MLKAKVDANHTAVVGALRGIGCSVVSLARNGKGVPDLLVGYRGMNLLLEVKDGDKSPSKTKLTPDQVKFHATWRGSIFTVYTPIEAIEVVNESVSKNGLA